MVSTYDNSWVDDTWADLTDEEIGLLLDERKFYKELTKNIKLGKSRKSATEKGIHGRRIQLPKRDTMAG